MAVSQGWIFCHVTPSQCSGKCWQLLAHNKSRFYSNLSPKKLIFCNFGAVFSHFSFGANFITHFKIFALFWAGKNSIFELQNSWKIIFAKPMLFFMSQKWSIFPNVYWPKYSPLLQSLIRFLVCPFSLHFYSNLFFKEQKNIWGHGD